MLVFREDKLKCSEHDLTICQGLSGELMLLDLENRNDYVRDYVENRFYRLDLFEKF